MSDHSLSVLFADVTGSTGLYESHGDDAARAAISRCIEVLVEQMQRFRGRLVKSIGDEIMCVFEQPAHSVMAANEMQLAIRSTSEKGLFVTGPVKIKIGIHLGPGVEREDDVFGEAALVAQEVIKQAKADQILASAETVAALPPELRMGSRPLDRVESEGRDAPIDIVELIWEVNDLTQLATTQPMRTAPAQTRLRLRYRDTEVEMGEALTHLSLGRTDQNDLVVPAQLASRSHAVIDYRRGRFQLRDMSSNGTVLVGENSDAHLLRGETFQLEGRGVFCLGGAPENNPDGVVEFECE